MTMLPHNAISIGRPKNIPAITQNARRSLALAFSNTAAKYATPSTHIPHIPT